MTCPIDEECMHRLLLDYAERASQAPVPASADLILLKNRMRTDEDRAIRGRRIETWAFAWAVAVLSAACLITGFGFGLGMAMASLATLAGLQALLA